VILFDLDGTLIDSNGIWENIDTAFLGRRGLQSTEEYAHRMGQSIFPVAAQLTKDYFGLTITVQEIMDEWMALAGDAYHHVPLKPGAAEFLARCHAEGAPMAIVTACVPDLCRIALARHGLDGYFQTVIFAQELGLEKRDPQVFHRSAKLLDASPETCTLYEDAPANCAAAKAAGMRVVGVYDPLYHKYEQEMRATCDRYIESFEELL
jgi:beta-phosphoglucomutase-like phosphatase (HAD superfamily)